ncbi:type-2 ice-structuring protein-like isoform X1 [Thunnus albacares]|uniref:type-2 ice-structuring protein-like isoform X1 n=1 Tax=Thunnus albacares TaxID=8236 RepID=UPI001CF645FF|nr:type-2 ice-structuring protein-like isoform X1 [Thunnus albacares]
MKMLTVAALMCTIMALTTADDPAEAKSENDQTVSSAETDLVKRTYGCSYGWRRICGRCFRYVARPLRWAQAEKNCQAMGGNLASVHSYREYRSIQRLIVHRCHRYREIWIGGHDGEEERAWLWSNGRRFNYRNWCRGEPNNSRGSQHCLQMNHTVRRCWDDDHCYKRKPSVCVKRRY